MGAPWQPRGPDDLDQEQRARIRRRVLQGVRRLRRRTISDGLYDLVALLAAPAPHLVRGIVAVAVIVSIVGTATVASADALPEQPLYGVKLAGEQVRLALARTPGDRAAVELSLAEHRLSEAERLAQAGREPDALIATGSYGAHLANAAAELAAVERLEPAARPVVERLKQRLADQQRRAAEVAAQLVADPVTAAAAPLFRTVASFAPALPSGSSVSEGIAAHAASVAAQLAATAERLARTAADAEKALADEDQGEEEGSARRAVETSRPTAGPGRGPGAGAAATPRGQASRPERESRATPAPRRTPAHPTATSIAAAAVRTPDATKPPLAPTAKPTARPEPTAGTQDRAKAQAGRAAAEKAKAESEKARHAAEKVKAEAEKARHAAEKAKEAAKRTAAPKPPRR